MIARHGDNITAYDAWKKASRGKGDELTALFTQVFAWKKTQPAVPADATLPRKMSLDEIRDACMVDGKVNWEAYWEMVAKQPK